MAHGLRHERIFRSDTEQFRLSVQLPDALFRAIDQRPTPVIKVQLERAH
jgi:hypothetical protein